MKTENIINEIVIILELKQRDYKMLPMDKNFHQFHAWLLDLNQVNKNFCFK